MKENSNFFERILQIIEYHNIKSVNSFAKDYLNYDSSEKINRLKDPNKNPSYEILSDISNKFENIDANWLLTGSGEMLRKSYNLENKKDNLNSENIFYKDKYISELEENKQLRIEIDSLKTELFALKKERAEQVSDVKTALQKTGTYD